MEKTSKLVTYALIAYGLLVSGCGHEQQAETVGQICMAGAYKRQAMQAAEEYLSKIHFDIDKADVEQGYIRTRPLTGAQWFEFWRSESIGSFNTAEANIQDIRRTVELNFGPLDDKLCINCVVTVQRLSLPERQVASRARAHGMFTKSGQNFQRLKLSEVQQSGAEWLDLGRDNALETEILKRLENRITKLQEAK